MDGDVVGTRGKTISWRIEVTKPDAAGVEQPVDLSLVGMALRVTVRRSRQSAAVYLYKTVGVAGGPGGVLLDPGVAAHNVAVVTIPPGDTSGERGTILGAWEAELTEQDGTVTNVASGAFKLRDDLRRGNAP